MIEDKLTHDERVRLEAMAQAVTSFSYPNKPPASSADLIGRARLIEMFITEGRDYSPPGAPGSVR